MGGSRFDAQTVILLDSLWQMKDVVRLKAVFGTNEGWWRFNYVFGDEAFQKSSYRRDSRLELLIQGDTLPVQKQSSRDYSNAVDGESSPNYPLYW